MVHAKKISDSYKFENGACPMPRLYDSTHRTIMPAVLATIPPTVTHRAALEADVFLKTQEKIYKNAASA
jgi:hypothetical protein